MGNKIREVARSIRLKISEACKRHQRDVFYDRISRLAFCPIVVDVGYELYKPLCKEMKSLKAEHIRSEENYSMYTVQVNRCHIRVAINNNPRMGNDGHRLRHLVASK